MKLWYEAVKLFKDLNYFGSTSNTLKTKDGIKMQRWKLQLARQNKQINMSIETDWQRLKNPYEDIEMQSRKNSQAKVHSLLDDHDQFE